MLTHKRFIDGQVWCTYTINQPSNPQAPLFRVKWSDGLTDNRPVTEHRLQDSYQFGNAPIAGCFVATRET